LVLSHFNVTLVGSILGSAKVEISTLIQCPIQYSHYGL